MELRSIVIWLTVGLVLTGCSNGELSDAYGQFEADPVIISAEATGVLREFNVEEGEQLEAGQQVGLIDTTQLALQKNELKASLRAVHANIAKLEAQAEIYKEQLATAQKELNRITNLKEEQAATEQQADQALGQVKGLNKQIQAVEVQKRSVYAELESVRAKIARVEDQLKKANIVNPAGGFVLSRYAMENELVSAGKPLYEIADLNQMELRVYISGAQLPQISLGQNVEVIIDKDATSTESLAGKVSWIASEAEFTPRMIQTKEERITQVYGVKIRVNNPEGKLKIGMPGEVNFTPKTSN